MRTFPEGLIRLPVSQGLHHVLGRQIVRLQSLGIDVDDDGVLVAAERRRRRDARQAGEHRPDLEQGLVLDFADALGLAGQHQVADRHAAGIEAHAEGPDGAGRHEGPCPVDVLDRLGHGLGHVGFGVEEELHEGDALDVLRLDVVDAADVEEVVFVVVGDQPLHLGRVETAVRLGHVDHREVEVGEDVDLHPGQRQAAAQEEGKDANHHRIGVPQREDDRVHRFLLPRARRSDLGA